MNCIKRSFIAPSWHYPGGVGKCRCSWQVFGVKVLPCDAEKPSLVVVDPPRAGLGPVALQQVLALEAPKVLYISCNPKTQALDCAGFREAGYRIAAVRPVDQFPHTPHIENIIILEK